MFNRRLFLSLYYSYTYPRTAQLSVCAWFSYVEIVWLFHQSVKIISQNSQIFRGLEIDMFLSMSHPSFIDTNGFNIINYRWPCAWMPIPPIIRILMQSKLSYGIIIVHQILFEVWFIVSKVALPICIIRHWVLFPFLNA